MNISRSFAKLIERVQPTAFEINASKKHLGTIRSRLAKAFQMHSCQVTGSFQRSTLIHGFSDTDLFAVFRKNNFLRAGTIISSTSVLENVRQELLARFASTALGKNGMAITIEFSRGQIVDIVPALFDSMFDGKWPVYLIPDGQGGWIHSSPSLYDAFIKRADVQSGGKLKYTAQILKFWRGCRVQQVPLSSFYIEMVLASESICQGIKSYAECVRDLFRNLSARNCRAVRDPYQISGLIPAARKANQLDYAISSVHTARNHANDAVHAEARDTEEAHRQWKIVFLGQFPG